MDVQKFKEASVVNNKIYYKRKEVELYTKILSELPNFDDMVKLGVQKERYRCTEIKVEKGVYEHFIKNLLADAKVRLMELNEEFNNI